MMEETTDVENKTRDGSQKTVEELFEDEDEEEIGEIIEYVDMVDEGYFAPAWWMIAVLAILVAGSAAGVGWGIYYAWDNRNNEDPTPAPRGGPPLSPTLAPVIPGEPTASPTGGFACNICALGDVTIPEGIVDIVGRPLCMDLQAKGEGGELTEGQCQLIQAVTDQPCGCGGDGGEGVCTVCADGSPVGDPNGVLDVTAAGVPGVETLTCGQLEGFAQQGLIPPESCSLLQAAAAETCQCETFPTETNCTVCAEGEIQIPDGVLDVSSVGIPGIETLTCGQLDGFAKQGSIPAEYCPQLQAASVDVCGCQSGSTASCTVCAEGDVGNPDGVIDVSSAGYPGIETLTCGQLETFAQQGLISPEFCVPLQAVSSDICDCGTNSTAPSAPEISSSCTVCAEGEVRNPSGVVDLSFTGDGTRSATCAELTTAAGTISDQFCVPLQEAAVDVCDCGPVDEGAFACPVCPEGTITNPDTEVTFAGQTSTCGGLEAAAAGQVTEASCPTFQTFAQGTCTCGTSDPNQRVLDLLGSVVGNDVNTPGTSAYLAAQYILNQDPRFHQARRHRKTMALYQSEPDAESNNTGVLMTVDSNATDLPPYEPVDDSAKNEVAAGVGGGSSGGDGVDGSSGGGGTEEPPASSPLVSLNDLTDAQIIQRYLLVLLYFQTTENLVEPWDTDCAAAATSSAVADDSIQVRRRQLQETSSCSGGLAKKWLSEAMECEWFGVSCNDSTEEISELKLSGIDLKGELPSTILLLPGLSSIDFSQNRLNGIIPDAYMKSATTSSNNSLEYLNLSNNTLEGSLPTMDLATLKVLDVSNNLLETNILIQSAAALESLNISYNDLTGDLSGVQQAPLLVSLDATKNKLAGILSSATEALSNLVQLTSLKLGENFFSGTLPSSGGMTLLTNLQVLDLSENNLQGSIPPELISSLAALTSIDLSGNALEGSLPSELGQLTMLTSLLLFDNFLTGEVPSELANVVALEEVNLGKNEFVGQVPAPVCALPNGKYVAVDCEELICDCCTCCNDVGCGPEVTV